MAPTSVVQEVGSLEDKSVKVVKSSSSEREDTGQMPLPRWDRALMSAVMKDFSGE